MLDDLIEGFLEFKQANQGRSARTADQYRLVMKRFSDFLGKKAIQDVNGDDLAAFSGPWLHKLGIKPSNRRVHVVCIREFFKWANRGRKIRGNPAAGLEGPKTGRKVPRIITLENAEKLIWAPDVSTFKGLRDSAIISILIGCGPRASGVAGLNESSIIQDRIDGKVRLMLLLREKGDKQRKIPLPQEADLLLRMYLDHPELKEIDRTLPDGDKVLFVTLRNRCLNAHEYVGEARRITRRAIWDVVQHYGKLAGIPDDQLHPHAMRHLFGTELAEDDIDILHRQELLGHEDPKSTKIYTSMAMRKLTRVIDQGNPLGKMNTPVSELLKRLGKSAS